MNGRSAVAVCQRKRLITFNVAVVDFGLLKWAATRDPLSQIGDTMNKGGSPYDAKCNVAEIGAVNMGEIGAVRKRSR